MIFSNSCLSEEKIGTNINLYPMQCNISTLKSTSIKSLKELKLNYKANIMIVDDNPFNLFVLKL